MPNDLTDGRLLWWNTDFLSLMFKRWQISSVDNVADVGSGQGHWLELILRAVEVKNAAMIDVNYAALEIGQKRLGALGLAKNITLVEGSAYQIPLESASQNFTTCQTLLIHLHKPELALNEMKRITKVGGHIVCVEPFDLGNSSLLSESFLDEGPEAVAEHFAIWAHFLRQRFLAGKGDLNIGIRLPRLFKEQGLDDVQVYLSDCAEFYLPPYKTLVESKRMEAAKKASSIESETRVLSNLEQTLASSPLDRQRIANYIENAKRRYSAARQSFQDGTATSSGGKLLFLVSGRRVS